MPDFGNTHKEWETLIESLHKEWETLIESLDMTEEMKTYTSQLEKHETTPVHAAIVALLQQYASSEKNQKNLLELLSHELADDLYVYWQTIMTKEAMAARMNQKSLVSRIFSITR